MNIMGMGWQEIMIVLVGALLIFGPDRLPEVAGQIGKFLRDLRKMTTDLTGEFEKTAGVGDIKKAVQSELAGVKSTVNSATSGVKSTVTSATSSTSSASKSSSSSAKPSTAVTAASGSAKNSSKATSTSTAKESAPAPKPVASKKDPLADVSFFDDVLTPASRPAAANGTVTIPASSSSNGHAKSESAPAAPAVALDALGRARQRRLAAGYNRHTS
jgi:sec-independent protein translocase protein TatB